MEDCTDTGQKKDRPTLVDKLLASGYRKNTLNVRIGTYPESTEEWHKLMENTEKVEKDLFDRVGKSLQVMAEQVKAARTVPKTVQTALAEAVETFKEATAARAEHNLARTQWINRTKDGGVLDTRDGEAIMDTANQSEIIKEIRKIDIRLSEQNEKINMLTKNVTTIIEQKIPSKRHQTNNDNEIPESTPWTEVINKKPKTRPVTARKKAPAVIIKTGKLSYTEALQKIRTEPKLKEFVDDIMSMRKTADGNLLVEMGKNSTNVENINSAIKNAIGEVATVSTLERTAREGIFGLDEITTEDEVKQAYISALGEDSEVKIVMRKIPRGQQMAIVTSSVKVANKVAKLGRIRVGYVSCRARLWQEIKRCYRCLATGHETKNCSRTDRTGNCMGCGEQGHFIKDCKKSDEERTAFRRMLREEEDKHSSGKVTGNSNRPRPEDGNLLPRND